MRLRDTILITGASSGIGKATALYLAKKGYRVIGTSRSKGRLGEIAAAAAHGLPITGVEIDINCDESVSNGMGAVLAEHGRIDVLVNNAGYGLWGPIERLTLDEVKAQFESNLFAVLRMIRAVAPGMMDRGYGKIINMSSVEGRLATPYNGAYASSKFALEGMSEALRAEMRPFGVFVAVVEPGLFRTDFQQNQVIGREVDEGAGSERFAPHLARYRTKHRRFERFASDPVRVAKVVHRAVRSRRPAFRYPVGLDARLGMLGARLLPERLFQALVSRVTM